MVRFFGPPCIRKFGNSWIVEFCVVLSSITNSRDIGWFWPVLARLLDLSLWACLFNCSIWGIGQTPCSLERYLVSSAKRHHRHQYIVNRNIASDYISKSEIQINIQLYILEMDKNKFLLFTVLRFVSRSAGKASWADIKIWSEVKLRFKVELSSTRVLIWTALVQRKLWIN